MMGLPPGRDELREFLVLPKGGEVPVLPAPALVLLKLATGRRRVLADVWALPRAGLDLGEVRTYLGRHAPELVHLLARPFDESP